MSEHQCCEESLVKVQGSDVYFHCEVCELSVLELNMKIKKLEVELLMKHLELGIDHIKPEIRVWIRSDGGDMHSGLSAMDCLKSMTRVKIRTLLTGSVHRPPPSYSWVGGLGT